MDKPVEEMTDDELSKAWDEYARMRPLNMNEAQRTRFRNIDREGFRRKYNASDQGES